MRSFAMICLCSLATNAQTPKSEEPSTLRGSVRNSATGGPVSKAAFTLVPLAAPDDWLSRYHTTSGASGAFEFGNVLPGKYRLRISRTGFVAAEYGARRTQMAGTVLDLTKAIKDLDVRITPHGVIAGRVLDAEGDPIESAQVHLLRSRYVNGKKVLAIAPQPSNGAQTNDLGEYRWAGLTPGRYYLHISHVFGFFTAAEEYVPIYYPDSLESTGALAVEVTPGASVRVGDMVLRKAHLATVKGRVVVEVAGAHGIPTVRLHRRIGHDNSGASSWRDHAAKVNAAGEFEARAVPPGSYDASAEVAVEDRGHVGTVPVNVAGNVEGVVITIAKPISLTGHVRVEGETAMVWKVPQLLVERHGREEMHRLEADRSFRIEHLQRDQYRIAATGLPDGFYTKSVSADGMDITYAGLDLKAGVPQQLEVVVSPKAGVIFGHVTGKPASGATVVLVPKEKSRRMLYRETTSNEQGLFAFQSVVPGDYQVYAWEDVESTAWLDPGFLKAFEEKGVPVAVAESGKVPVDVAVIPAEPR